MNTYLLYYKRMFQRFSKLKVNRCLDCMVLAAEGYADGEYFLSKSESCRAPHLGPHLHISVLIFISLSSAKTPSQMVLAESAG